MPRVAKWLGDAMEALIPSKMPLMEVVETNYISPKIKRIRFQGNLSGMSFQPGYAVLIRVNETEFRNYTVVFNDVENGILEIIFYIHGQAPGSLFIDNLNVGDEIRISAPRGKKQYEPTIKQHLIFGDETSLGLACSFLPYLKKNQHQFQFYFELDESNFNVPQLLGLENYSVFSKNDIFINRQLINDLPIFNSPDWNTSHFVLTGNATSVQNFRHVLKSNSVKGRIFTKGYWLKGKAGL
ncbi:siderophore-interacting protein [Albibacterium bauzanense]|uniref:Flavin-dependent oxidoreductase n=1 Tax=Albibacterium bauzanense TaxID=653929 RepID=A0A4R1M191_9SPHI|nr:siderophore-interacting protein [Albibacterium bauzanense]TCK85087.1 flavin-dependent oxidoreductase [Albibacterium bauzanense]